MKKLFLFLISKNPIAGIFSYSQGKAQNNQIFTGHPISSLQKAEKQEKESKVRRPEKLIYRYCKKETALVPVSDTFANQKLIVKYQINFTEEEIK